MHLSCPYDAVTTAVTSDRKNPFLTAVIIVYARDRRGGVLDMTDLVGYGVVVIMGVTRSKHSSRASFTFVYAAGE